MNLGLGLGFSYTTQGSKIFDDHQALMTWHENTSQIVPLISLARTSYRENVTGAIASIESGAGPQSGETVGNLSGTTVGLTDSGALTTRAGYTIASEANASAIATSGTGTSVDPYLVEDLDFFGNHLGAGGVSLRMNDAAATYYVKFRNCRFRDASNFEVWLDAFGTTVEFENCDFFDVVDLGGDTFMVRIDEGGNWTFTNCLFAGSNATLHCIGLNGVGAGVTLYNCKFDESQADWLSTVCLVSCIFKAGTIDLDYVEFDGTLTAVGDSSDQTFINIQGGVDTLIINNTYAEEGRWLIGHNSSDSTIVKSGTITITNTSCIDQDEYCVFQNHADTVTIRYSSFQHINSGTNKQCVLMSGIDGTSGHHVENFTVEYCYINKAYGNNAGLNEALQSNYPGNVVFSYNFIENCVEDGIEMLYVLDKSDWTRIIAYNYIKNCTNQAINIANHADYSTWSAIIGPDDLSSYNSGNVYIHHNYGNCNYQFVISEGVRGVFGHDYYGTHGPSPIAGTEICEILERTSGIAVDIEPRDCFFAGPFALAADREDDVGAITNTTHDCTITFFDNENGTGSLTTVTS